MDKYSYKDIIIDHADPRLEIGGSYYRADYPKEVLYRANEDSILIGTLECIEREDPVTPFVIKEGSISTNWACIIRKKEPEKKYVPFKLSDRDALSKLMGCWLIDKDHGDYYCITAIYPFDERVYIPDYGDVSPEELLENFTFMFDGTPCGQEVEE